MLVFSWAINFEVNWKSSNSKDSWGHWQHVWLIMTHESTLTLVIAGYWWVGNSTWEFEGKRFPLPQLFFFQLFFPFYRQNQKRIFFFLLSSGRPSFSLHFLYLSPSRASCYFSFLHPAWWVFCGERVWWGVFQHFINPCLCCLICYPFRFMVFPLSMWAD